MLSNIGESRQTGSTTVSLCVYWLILKPLRKAPKKAIIVLGGGLTETGEVPLHTQLRLNRAVELYKKHGDQTVIITLSGGTPHKPNPVDPEGFPVWEATAAAKRLLAMGIPADNVMEEAFSLDTLGNAYFLRTLHMDPSDIRDMVVITNAFHMDRSKAMFEVVFALPLKRLSGNPVEALLSVMFGGSRSNYRITYDTVADGLEGDVLEKRREREQASLRAFLSSTQYQFHDMKELHQWIFTKHAAYASSRLTKQRTPVLDSATLKSY